VIVPDCSAAVDIAGTWPNVPAKAPALAVEPEVALGPDPPLPVLLELVQAAMPTASRAAAPAAVTRAIRGRRLFGNINYAP
jgi:hypothetical protein